MKTTYFFAPILAVTGIAYAHAFDYNCADQQVSGHTVNLQVGEEFGTEAWARYTYDGEAQTVSVMQPNGDNDFISARMGDVAGGDVEVSINTLTQDDGTNTITLKIKSLKFKGDLSCTGGM
jgi:hypothetical protein